MSEATAPVAVAKRPDAWHVGAQFVVDNNVASLILLDSGFVEAEVVGVGFPADGQQNVSTLRRLRIIDAVDARKDLVTALLKADASGIGANRDALFLDNTPDC